MNIKSALNTFFILSLALPSGFVFGAELAQSNQLQSANDELQKTIESSSAETQAETRKTLVEKVLEVTKLEIEELEKSVKELVISDKESLALQSSYQAYLEEAKEELASFSVRFENEEDLSTLAEEIKEWRFSYYDPANQQIFAFLLLPRLDRSVTVAALRAEKIAADLRRLQNRFDSTTNAQLNFLLKEALAEIAQAQEKQVKAKEILIEQSQALLRVDEPSEEEIIDLNVIEPVFETSTIQDIEPVEESIRFAEEALVHIKNAYQKFLIMSRFVKAQLSG
ncbi:MAG: hypothetical protein Q8P45_01910 [Candidatus Harrisonbacteria bacterium]|nr:hypothetical protein [Candidatus Harrisonbacteria bacterium]